MWRNSRSELLMTQEASQAQRDLPSGTTLPARPGLSSLRICDLYLRLLTGELVACAIPRCTATKPCVLWRLVRAGSQVLRHPFCGGHLHRLYKPRSHWTIEIWLGHGCPPSPRRKTSELRCHNMLQRDPSPMFSDRMITHVSQPGRPLFGFDR